MDYIISGLLATISIFVLMVINMVGFAVGLEGAKDLLTELVGNKVLIFIMVLTFFGAA